MWRLAEKLLIATKKKRKALILLTNPVLFFSFLPSPESKKEKKGKEWLDYPSLPASYTRASAPSL
jgi:hypothetical protein